MKTRRNKAWIGRAIFKIFTVDSCKGFDVHVTLDGKEQKECLWVAFLFGRFVFLKRVKRARDGRVEWNLKSETINEEFAFGSGSVRASSQGD